LRQSWLGVLSLENHTVVKQIGSRFVGVDFEDFGDESATGPAFYMDNGIQGVGNIGLDCGVWKINSALQYAGCEAGESLPRGVRVNRRNGAGVAGIQELQEFECLSASDLTQQNTIRAVPERRLHRDPHRALAIASLSYLIQKNLLDACGTTKLN
jgi:hypothetical protein